MAGDELSLRTHVKFLNGEVDVEINEGTKRFDAAGEILASGVQIVGTSVEALDKGDVDLTKVGLCYLKNLDDTNFVQYGPDDGGGALENFARLSPMREALFEMDLAIVVGMLLKADTAPVNVKFLLIQETP